MRKLVLMAVAMALVTVLPAGAQANTKTKTISTGIYLDVSGYIDRHGGVFYFWGGDLDAKRSACRDGRTVTLFRVEPNGTATPVGSNTSLGDTPDVLNSSFGDLLERPLDAITGYYYAEVAPKRVKTTNQKEPKNGVTVVVPFKRAKKVTLNCLGARSPTIYVQVPAGLLTSP